MNSIEILYNDVLLSVFDHCDLKTWAICKRVCKIWKEICNKRRVSLDFSKENHTREQWIEIFKKAGKVYTSCINLSYTNCIASYPLLNEAFEMNVKELILNGTYTRGTPANQGQQLWQFLQQISQKTMGLESLSLLDYGNENPVSEDDFRYLTDSFKSLKRLSIIHNGWQNISLLSECFPKLEELHLHLRNLAKKNGEILGQKAFLNKNIKLVIHYR